MDGCAHVRHLLGEGMAPGCKVGSVSLFWQHVEDRQQIREVVIMFLFIYLQ